MLGVRDPVYTGGAAEVGKESEGVDGGAIREDGEEAGHASDFLGCTARWRRVVLTE